jgi:hypothetical protein
MGERDAGGWSRCVDRRRPLHSIVTLMRQHYTLPCTPRWNRGRFDWAVAESRSSIVRASISTRCRIFTPAVHHHAWSPVILYGACNRNMYNCHPFLLTTRGRISALHHVSLLSTALSWIPPRYDQHGRYQVIHGGSMAMWDPRHRLYT